MIEAFFIEFLDVFANSLNTFISTPLFWVLIIFVGVIPFSLALANEKHANRLNDMIDQFCETYESVPVLGICGLIPLYLNLFTFSSENTALYTVFASKKMFRYTVNGVTRPIERFVTSVNPVSLPSFGPIMMMGSTRGYEPEIVVYKTGSTRESDDDANHETELYQLDQTSQHGHKDAGKRARLLRLLSKLENLEAEFSFKVEAIEQRIYDFEHGDLRNVTETG